MMAQFSWDDAYVENFFLNIQKKTPTHGVSFKTITNYPEHKALAIWH